MIAAFHDVHRGRRRHPPQQRFELRRRAECIPAALNDKHRPADLRQVRIAKFAGSSRRMERVPEQHQTGQWKIPVGSREVRGDATTHGFAANEEKITFLEDVPADVGDDRGVARFERRTTIRHSAVLFDVQEIERDDVDTVCGQRLSEGDHEWASLTRASSVGEDQQSPDPWFCPVGERRNAGARPEGDGQLVRTFQAELEPPLPF